MRKNKGITLVEVILSIMILGIIGSCFVVTMTQQVRLMSRTKNITAKALAATKDMEKDLDQIRAAYDDPAVPDPPGYTYSNVFKSDINVVANHVKINISDTDPNDILFSLAADYERAKLKAPEIKVSIDGQDDVINNEINVYFGERLEGSEETISQEDEDIFFKAIGRWYVSKSGYYMPYPDTYSALSINDLEFLPRWRDDFQSIQDSEHGGDKIIDVSPYRGQQLVYASSAAAKSGKIGNIVPSIPIYIPGLTFTNNIVFQLDASITKSNVSGSDLLSLWKDYQFSSYSASGGQAQLVPGISGNDTDGKSFIKFLRFKGDNSMSININSGLTEYTLFVVARPNSAGKKPGRILSTFDSSNANCFDLLTSGLTIYDSSGVGYTWHETEPVQGDEWRVYTIGMSYPPGDPEITFEINDSPIELPEELLPIDPGLGGPPAPAVPVPELRLGPNPVTIGNNPFDTVPEWNNGTDIAEIILYEKALSSSDKNEVKDYLRKKYKYR